MGNRCHLFYHFPLFEDEAPVSPAGFQDWVRCDVPLCHLTDVTPTSHSPFKTNLDEIEGGK